MTTSAVGALAARASDRLRHVPWRRSDRATTRASSGESIVGSHAPARTSKVCVVTGENRARRRLHAAT